jgi:hypothetical protein
MRHASNDSKDIFAVISLWAESDEKELRPFLAQGMGIVYDLAGFHVTYEKIKIAEKKGFLKTAGSTSFSSCPKCQSHVLQVQLVCPDCKFQSIVKSDLLIHYDCQYSGPVEEFRSSLRDGYFCRKCNKELKRVGIDYGNPGIGFKCSNCEKVFQFPVVLSYCDEGHSSKIDELDLRSYPNFVIGDNAPGLAKVLADSRALHGILQKSNIHSELTVQLAGASGTNHLIPLLVTTPAGDKVAVEFTPEEPDIEQIILQLLLKSADLEKTRMVIISRSTDLVAQITQLVNPQKVRAVHIADMARISDNQVKKIVE